MKYKLKVILLFTIIYCNINAQSNINPDISLIGTFNTYTNFNKGTSEYGKLNFETPSLELFIDGYLNPFAKAGANISFENEQFGVEELYGNIVRGLPFDLQVKAGKFLVGFGKLNTVHPHAWPFLERPLWHQVFFGDGGLKEVGINISLLLPTEEIYTNLEIGIYKGLSFSKLADSNFVDRGVNPVFVGRLNSFFPIGDYGNLEVGLSSSYGVYSKGSLTTFSDIHAFTYFYTGIDFKYKYTPDSYTALTIQGEGILNHRNVAGAKSTNTIKSIYTENTITNSGAFIYFDYKFQKQFSFGIKYDYTAGIISDIPSFTTLANDNKNSTQGIEGWFSYYPVEETSVIRFGIQHLFFDSGDNVNRDPQTTIKLQFLFSLGPHKAHPF